MTTLVNKALRRETGGQYRGRPLVVELGEFMLTIRLKGTRKLYIASYEQIFKLGAENEARRRRAEREAKLRAKYPGALIRNGVLIRKGGRRR